MSAEFDAFVARWVGRAEAAEQESMYRGQRIEHLEDVIRRALAVTDWARQRTNQAHAWTGDDWEDLVDAMDTRLREVLKEAEAPR